MSDAFKVTVAREELECAITISKSGDFHSTEVSHLIITKKVLISKFLQSRRLK